MFTIKLAILLGILSFVFLKIIKTGIHHIYKIKI